MPNALRTATPMGDWRSFKAVCDISAGWEGIKTAMDADTAAARHPWLYLVGDSVAAILEDADFEHEGVGIYHAEKIIVAKGLQTIGFNVGERVYWDPTDRLVYPDYESTRYWIGIATENADGLTDLTVEIDLKGDRAEVELAL